MSAISIIIVIACVVYVIQNTARRFVQIQNSRERQQFIDNIMTEQAANAEAAKKRAEIEEMVLKNRRNDPNYITDAEIIE